MKREVRKTHMKQGETTEKAQLRRPRYETGNENLQLYFFLPAAGGDDDDDELLRDL